MYFNVLVKNNFVPLISYSIRTAGLLEGVEQGMTAVLPSQTENLDILIVPSDGAKAASTKRKITINCNNLFIPKAGGKTLTTVL